MAKVTFGIFYPYTGTGERPDPMIFARRIEELGLDGF